ncbi:MAG: hypothetical protein NVSMB57_16860 [Actinomycetota bacterium]
MKRPVIIAAVASVLVIILFYAFLLSPVSASINQAKKDLDAAKSQELALKTRLSQLRQAERSATDIDARLQKFGLLLPSSPDLPTFIRQLQAAANESSIDLASFAPSPPAPVAAGPGSDPALANKGVFSINCALSVSGGFFRIKSFLQRLESLQRVVQVSNVTLTPQPDPLTGITVLASSMTITLYVVNPRIPLPGATTPPVNPSASPSPSVGGSGPATPAPTSTR